jgi:DNA-binding transcriptional LysR family regulator
MSTPISLNFRTLDLNLLRVFDVVMAERNLTRAAARLALTQPAVSNALRRLKDAVGDELLTRAPGGVAPTPRAAALWPEVRLALGSLQAALAPAEFVPSETAASFRIAISDAAATTLMPALIAEIDRDAPRVDLRLLPLTTGDPVRMLERDEADLAVAHFPEAAVTLAAAGADAPLRAALLHRTRTVCVLRRGHPMAAVGLDLDAYCAARHVLVSYSGRADGRADQALRMLGRERRIVLTVNQYATAAQVIAQSDLIAVLPEAFVGRSAYRGDLVCRPLPFVLDDLDLRMVWHRRNARETSHAWLRGRLLAAAAPAETATPAG